MKKNRIISIEDWKKYIDDNITSFLTTDNIAEALGYSTTQFKRLFNRYLHITVSDYVRKKRLFLVAEKIRGGMDYMKAGRIYGFTTHAGLSRAFSREFLVTPYAYQQASHEIVETSGENMQVDFQFRVDFLNIKELKFTVKCLFVAEGNQIDFPAQIDYWKKNPFPVPCRKRQCCNKRYLEDVISLWYHSAEELELKYLLGNVVSDFKEKGTEKIWNLSAPAGRYAIFYTGSMSDADKLADIIRLYEKYIVNGWCKEQRDRIDLTRMAFERYVDNKVYFYIPVKE